MAKVLGEGAHRYEVIEDWGTLPPGWTYGEVAAVGVDSHDNVYVFSRGEHPMTVFDREGRFLRSWGEGLFARAGRLIATQSWLQSISRWMRTSSVYAHATRYVAQDCFLSA